MPQRPLARPRWAARLVPLALSVAGLAMLASPAPADAAPGATPPAKRFDFDSAPGLLAKDVRPSRVRLHLALDPSREAFDGRARIDIDVRRAVPALVLHAQRLEAGDATLVQAGRRRALAIEADAGASTWRLVPVDGRPVPAGRHRVELHWRAPFGRGGAGLFRAVAPADGGAAPMLATQLQPVNARQVFPAFDEPAFRAVYELTLDVPADLQALGNMRARRERVLRDGVRRVEFEPTPPMPAYLLAVAVGRFDALHGRAAGVPLRILTAPGRQAQARYAMDVTERLMPYFTRYFGVPYALPKLDQLAVPAGRRGAMEDWGLVSYAESLLLFDPARSGERTRRTIHALVAHELSHQWFGNLVTAASWEEIWLNEAFATWMEEKATDHFNPDWHLPLRRRGQIDRVMQRDAGPATRPIRSAQVPESAVFDVFDGITYVKGGAVLAMLEGWIGPGAFRRGLAAYMRERRLSNATAADLWHHLGRSAGHDVAAVAASWTDQPGFPLVRADATCEAGRQQLRLAQQRFVATPGPEPAAPAAPGATAPVWRIPIVVTQGATRQALLLTTPAATFDIGPCRAAEPPVVNPGGEGFYRVAHAPALQAALAARFAQWPGATQVTLLNDAYALAEAGELPMTAWLDLLARVPAARGPGRAALLGMARQSLQGLGAVLRGTPAEASLHAAARALLAPELQALGWQPRPGEDDEAALLRSQLIGDLAAYGDEAVQAAARAAWQADARGERTLPAALRDGVTVAAAAGADADLLAAMSQRLRTATAEEERWRLAWALAGVADGSLAESVLALSLDASVDATVATAIPGMMAEHGRHGERAYAFAVANWAALAERGGREPGEMAWQLPGAAWAFNDRRWIATLRDDQHHLAGPDATQATERVAARIAQLAAVREREADALAASLPGWRPARGPQ